ncbi:carboxymuconolactone decarboxylase family protein [Paracoccus aminophilus]|uniref:Alkylhydroperoxidase n=1 Tax=Paracoccus aminophilus JCM 7686 TaxID=1367847 RepID=S5XWF0_PARAH|nr:carboxymuconolactone decarboxylase family protein [Paracoccus aminophilus]AGT09602.1 alkylhydroperoxidase [Paracoccus aminophilus JCM 7686]
MATVPLLSDDEVDPRALAVFNRIREARGTDYINNFWRALAHDPVALDAVWERLSQIMAPGALDPLVKELIYIAVSTAHGCTYCIHSHTASAKAKGMTPEQHAELLAVIGMASQTNALVTGLGVPVDARFEAN